MRKAPFIVFLILTLIAEAFLCFFMVSKVKDLKTDPVKVNECLYSISENYGDSSKYNTQLDYTIIGNDGELIYKTREGLSESVNEAIKTRGLILDLNVDGKPMGKVIFDYNMDDQLTDVKNKIILLFVIIGVLQMFVGRFYFGFL